MVPSHNFSKAEFKLKKLLSKERVLGFEVGDCWCLRFADWYLLSQEIASSKEGSISLAIKTAEPEILNCVDAYQVAQSAIVASIMRREISDISLDKDANLTLMFDGKIDVIFLSDVDIVDWQWCVSKSDRDPYHTQSEVACFWAGEVVTY